MSGFIKTICFAILFSSFSISAEAQIWKKIKNKTKQKIEDRAAEKISDKIAEAVMGKMSEKVESESNPYKVNVGVQISKPKDLPAEYTFDWEYKVKMVSNSSDEDIYINYMLPEDGNYFGYTMPEAEGMFSVIDFEKGAMISYMQEEGNSFAMANDYPTFEDMDEEGSDEQSEGLDVTELPEKEIAGYTAKGYQYETEQSTMIVYVTEEADVSFSGFGSIPNRGVPVTYGNQMSYSKDALMLYMKFTDKDNPENEMIMECVGLDKKKLVKKNSEYNFF